MAENEDDYEYGDESGDETNENDDSENEENNDEDEELDNQDPYGEDENPENSGEDGENGENGKNDNSEGNDGEDGNKKGNNKEANVEGEVEKKKTPQERMKEYKKNAKGKNCVGKNAYGMGWECPECKEMSIFRSARLFDFMFIQLPIQTFTGTKFDTYYCFNRKCEKSYWKSWCVRLPSMGTPIPKIPPNMWKFRPNAIHNLNI